MNLNIISIWESYIKNAMFDSLEDVLDYLEEEYDLTEDEISEISEVSRVAVAEDVDTNKLFKRDSSMKRKLDKDLYSSILALFINGVFFGLYLSRFLNKNKG